MRLQYIYDTVFPFFKGFRKLQVLQHRAQLRKPACCIG